MDIPKLPAGLRGRAIKENVDMDELISKKAVIEAIEKARENVGHNLERSIGKSIIEILDDVGRDINGLPSALGTNLAEVGTDCISRQAAIDAVRATLLSWSYMPEWRDNKIIEAVEQLPPIQTEPHWIPVTENTLPEKNRVVVVYGNKGTWDFGTYRGHGDNIHFWHWKKNTYKRVYWWMYKEDALPEPYKGVTDGRD